MNISGKRLRKKSLGDLVIAVDNNFLPMMEVSRRHALKALATERAEALDLDTWTRKALYEITDIHDFVCILYPGSVAIKDSKLKVQVAIQGDELRVSGKKRDDLQEAIAFVKGLKVDQPLQYLNFRD